MKRILVIIFGGLVLAAGIWFFGNDQSKSQDDLIPPPVVQNQTKTPPPSPNQTLPKNVHIVVPFTPQAPDADWGNPKFQDGCEEASVLMAMAWVNESGSFTVESAKRDIFAMADWQEAKYGSFHDTSAEDTVQRLFNEYYNYMKVKVVENISVERIKIELAEHKLVIVPMDGTLLGNPNYTPPGPTRHMIVIIGFDENKREFITNDPGTRRGKDYRYNYETFFNGIRDYPTGYKELNKGIRKNMIVVSK